MLGSGNKNQWTPVPGSEEDVPKAPSASGKFHQTVGMLTTDIALKTDPKYKRIVEQFAEVHSFELLKSTVYHCVGSRLFS